MNFESSPAGRRAALALLAAAGAVVFVLESFIPAPVPFMKIGLANITGVIALAMFGPRGVFLVTAVRVVLGSLFAGSLFSPAFLLAIGAGISAAAAMSIVVIAAPRLFSPLGVSLIGAVVHVFTQVALLSLLFVHSTSLAVILPFLLLTALAGGTIVGLASQQVLRMITGRQI